jgi:hypothetical protein
MMQVRWSIASLARGAIGPALLVVSLGANAGFTAEEKEVLRAAARQTGPYTSHELAVKANEVAMRAAKIIETHTADAESFEYLIEQGWYDRVSSLANWNGVKSRDLLQQLLRRYFDNLKVADPLMMGLQAGYDDPAILELLMGDVEALAKWRAEGRKACRYRVVPSEERSIPSTAPGLYSAEPGTSVEWRMKCTPGTDPRSVLPTATPGMLLARQWASLSLVVKTSLPGVDMRLAPLVRDLTLGVAFEEVPGATPGSYDETQLGSLVPTPREAVVDFADIAKVLAAKSKSKPTGDSMRSYFGGAYKFLALASMHDRRESAALIESWIRKLAASPEWADKERVLLDMVELAGTIRAEYQLDLPALRKEVLASVSDRQGHLRSTFDRAERENESLRTAASDSLFVWLRIPGASSTYNRVGRAGAVRYLASRGVPVNKPNHLGETPLGLACDSFPSIVPVLLALGADVNQPGGYNKAPPLLLASRHGGANAAEYRDVVSLLLSKGANPRQTDSEGNTALHGAAEANSVEIVRMLLAAGAAADAKTSQGVTPLHLAKDPSVKKRLQEAGAR